MSFETVFHGNLSRIIRLSDTAYLRLGNLPIRDQCNVGILLTTQGIVLIDYPEQHPGDEILREAEQLFHQKVTHIFFTHAHGDHRNGLSVFLGKDALSQKEILLLASPAGAKELRSCYPELPNSIRVLRDGETITIGKTCFSIQIPKLLPAHSPWDMLIGCETEGLLFTGDFLNPPDTLYFHSSNYRNWAIEMKSMLAQDRWKHLILGHGLPWTVQEGELSLSYLSSLGDLFEALQQESFAVNEKTNYSELFERFPHQRKTLAFLEKTAGASHVLRQLREIQHALA